MHTVTSDPISGSGFVNQVHNLAAEKENWSDALRFYRLLIYFPIFHYKGHMLEKSDVI